MVFKAGHSTMDLVPDPDTTWEMRVGYVHAAVGLLSLAAYPIGAILLEVKCGWSCMPTVSDVERSLSHGTDAWTVDVVRTVLMTLAVILRATIIPALVVQVFPLLRLHAFGFLRLQLLKTVFYTSLVAWTISDLLQLVVGNDRQHSSLYELHIVAARVDLTALILCNMALLLALSNDPESSKGFLVTGTMALLKIAAAGLFLTAKLATHNAMWQVVEWAMLVAIGGLQISIGLAMPAGLRLNPRRLKVFRADKNSILPGVGCGASGQTCGSMQSSILKRWY